MNTKLVLWTYDPAVTATDEVKTDHVEYLKGLLANGDLVAAGPRGDVAGGVLLFRGDTSDTALETFLADDPFTTAGLVATTEIVDWNAGLGALAAAA